MHVLFQAPSLVNCDEISLYQTMYSKTDSEPFYTEDTSRTVLAGGYEEVTFTIVAISNNQMHSEIVKQTITTPSLRMSSPSYKVNIKKLKSKFRCGILSEPRAATKFSLETIIRVFITILWHSISE